MRIAALLLAAGQGRRFSAGAPQGASSCKQFRMLRGKPVIRRAAESLLPHVDILLPVGSDPLLAESLQGLDVMEPVAGGAERHDSVRNGLEALASLPEPPDLVLVHDGARPYVPADVTTNVIKALETHAGVIPAVVVSDTIKKVHDHIIVDTISRDGLWRAQTPQGFHFKTLLELHRSQKDIFTDDAGLLERGGHPVAIVQGSENNIKLTIAEDLMRLEGVIDRNLLPRVGLGYDVHAFAEGRKLILCGIEIPHTKGLAGHSDADVGIHTLCDAIYGALTEGDIGRHFPPTDNEWKDMDSARFLVHAGERIRARGGFLVNADITLICERPKIGPHAQAMQQRLAELLQVSVSRISVKATTSEKLGFTGREEGIAATATVSIMVPDNGEP
ncbi:bifunctional 2-C-methyl-D-erythritol 4-phosphate cytidylyltransferase/2-C-methyl-D-erythritol 2,4-cyclodiphosphate synthase [Swingsia samuiensis]|uniref:Bifunctional enzyme IspD/IspF n=1 Tax=Swingsia samuiensis TaxID=1293412 RepID=A0A4Y6UJP3_9PROT|nr:bifunctional 2-C-methyl-D-erythritol 4-phosphate cytidylyltransferase/2-C-methyl-D-erythritol 2,4-cyclodiphosphate synthase [Swingsia samuiensis]QDH17274.1 bifunctional 2-C-methyl-D-erythritol 4-phosphate cytidylyltransferase/2-C-methyl-D-erythritol 2,4-cyclodiphosphate synthase [Swingsia samuiensis]